MVDPTHGLARNALGLPQVLFCIVTGAAPIAAMLFNDPWAVFGGGWAAPSAFIIATIGFTRLLRRLHRNGPARHRGRRLLQLRLARLRTDDRDGRGAAHRGLLPHLLGRRDRRHRVLREHDDQRLVRRRHPGLGVRVRHARGDDPVRLLPHRADGEDPRRLPRARADRTADVRHLRALPARRTGYVWSALLPWNFFDGDANGAAKAFGAGTVGVGIFGAFWSWIGFEMAPNYAEESQGPEADHGPRRPTSRSSGSASSTRSSAGCSWSRGARTASPAASPRSSTATSRRSSTRRPTGSSRSTSAAHRCSRGRSS